MAVQLRPRHDCSFSHQTEVNLDPLSPAERFPAGSALQRYTDRVGDLTVNLNVGPPSPGGLREIDKRNNRIRTQKTAEVVARHLAEFMIKNDLQEGSRLPAEKAMLELLGVGRGTLREALRLLEANGIVSIRTGPRGGPIVRRPQAGDLGETLMLLLQFEKTTLAEIYAARAAIEPVVTASAATRITDEELSQLAHTVEAISSESCDAATFREQNALFHALISQASDNSVLRLLSDALRALAEDVMAGVEHDGKTRKAGAEAHRLILDALQTGDAEAAERASLAHLMEAEQLWRKRFSGMLDRRISWT